ncbi:MAG: hypothetical protein ABEJ99_03615 [Candidatus Nanohaloarchaea archaeon]
MVSHNTTKRWGRIAPFQASYFHNVKPIRDGHGIPRGFDGRRFPDRKKTKTEGGLNITDLRSMDKYKFEEVVGDVWTERGWDTQLQEPVMIEEST